MAKQTIGIGSAANDGTGDPLRSAWDKANQNFTELYSMPFYQAGAKLWLPISHTLNGGAGSPTGANSIRLFLGYIGAKITINQLSARVSTLSVGGNFQLAIYRASSTTGMPTGTPVASTGSLTTTNVGAVNGAIADTQLVPGWYWFATNVDNVVAAFNGLSTGSVTQQQIIGAYSFVNGTTLVGLSVAQTFGTWPDLTATSWSSSNEVVTNSVPTVMFQIASVP